MLTILFLDAFFFLNYWVIIFNSSVIAKSFNPTLELVIPTGIQSKEAKTETELHPVTAEAKIRKCSI